MSNFGQVERRLPRQRLANHACHFVLDADGVRVIPTTSGVAIQVAQVAYAPPVRKIHNFLVCDFSVL